MSEKATAPDKSSDDRPWTDEENIRRLYLGEGLTCPEIAERWRCTDWTVDKWRRDFGIERDRPWRDGDVLRELYLEQGLSRQTIADELGCSKGTIDNNLQKHGIKKPKPWRDEELLRELYVEQRLSKAEMARQLGCEKYVIGKWIGKYEIERPPPKHRQESVLRELYVEKQLPPSEIFERLDCSSAAFYRGLKSAGISAHERPENPPWRDESILREHYVQEQQTLTEVADIFGCSPPTIVEWLEKFGIHIRGLSESQRMGAPEKLNDEGFLREQYTRNGRSAADIGEVVDRCAATVLSWLRYFDIPVRDGGFLPSEGDRPTRYYGPDWPQQREEARERDGYRCRSCGMADDDHKQKHGEELHVHHRIRFLDYAPFNTREDYAVANRRSNLLTLCRIHHVLWEHLPVQPLA